MNNRSIGVVLLCLLLIAAGAVVVLNLNFNGRDTVLGIAAIAAGILILIGR